ncbi:LOW QUALITY PROTEIN: brain-specific angiogenesis inhibitor 1-associated protein 2-like [Ylistrum balloti]|uniref:LOW QUALITY PROTEIN: brain-specific angiogenesis inhibitor 1-associated protein 2-like n=1 Tax=Ylistrum balloti TaxID=509963 RepID=UPI0029058B64|nr:LOW QUALITY PROTEIN: brain-specific angiogenesis inhibitor 1-associated protein 2-like [Ylistrum balloti]
MKNSEDVHQHTEAVYRGLTENFNPGIKQVLLCGKAYHKALQGLTASARAYSESLLKIGGISRSTCRGGTEEVGEAIFQIAEAQRDIQARIEESTKALFSELILPLEQKLENEFRRSSVQHKKYNHGHKTVLVPYAKAHDSLRKFRKKTKNKLVYDEQKEGQYVKTLSKCQEKLDEFRVQGLKLALLEERKCHCFLLERLSSIASMNAAHHRQATEMLSMGLPSWRHLSAKPHILPAEADRLLMIQRDEEFEHANGSIYRVSNGYVPDETRSVGTPYRRSRSYHDGPRTPMDYNGDFSYATRTMPPSRGISVPPPPPPGQSQVRAIYTHAAEGESKLSFTEGDVINLIGEPSDGWHYGLNNRSGRYGWFPLSFTEPMIDMQGREQMGHRVKSMGDLDTRSLSDGGSFLVDGDIPGAARRPKSVYEGSGLRLVNNPTQNVATTSGYGNRQSSSNPPPPPPPVSSSFQDDSRPGPPTSMPPPPPKMSNGQGGSHPAEDYETDEEDTKSNSVNVTRMVQRVSSQGHYTVYITVISSLQ